MPRPAYGFVTYLMEYASSSTFASRESPPTCVVCIVCDSINWLVNLIFDHHTSK